MTQTRFRPQVNRLEDRTTPAASPAELYAHLAAVQTDLAFMTALNQHPEYLVNGTYQVYTAGMLTAVVQRQQAVAADLGEFVAALQANAAADPTLAPTLNPAIQQFGTAQFQALTVATVAQLDLQYLYDALGFQPAQPNAPPVPPSPPVPPPDLTSDSGMTNALPDINNPAFQTQADGLKLLTVQEGVGEAVQPGADVEVYYTGWLTDGTVFDSRRSPNQPASFNTAGVIDGFEQALIGMKPGEIRQVVIPPDLGYGAAGQPPNIPGNATLVFEIKLIAVDNP